MQKAGTEKAAIVILAREYVEWRMVICIFIVQNVK